MHDYKKTDEVLLALRRAIRATDLHSKYLSKTTGLTAPQILLLQSIRDKGQGSSLRMPVSVKLLKTSLQKNWNNN